MKKLGMLYGCDVYLDTDDETVVQQAIAYNEMLQKTYRDAGELEIEKEMAKFKQPKNKSFIGLLVSAVLSK